MKKKSIIIGALACLIMGCSGPDSGKKENSSVGQDTIMPATKSDTISAKKEEEKEPEEEVATTPNGTYINGQKSKLSISNYSAQSFNFSYKLKGACDGFEDAGLAVFTSKNSAVQYSEDGTVIVSFTFGKDGSIEFGLDMGPDYFGMDCLRFFDSNFVKK